MCEGIAEFLQPKGRAYRGLLVRRPQDGRDIQRHVDKIAKSDAFNGEDRALQEEIDVCCTKDFALDLSKKAQRLATLAVRAGLPKETGCQIEQDFEEIGAVMMKLVPTAKQMLLKLDIMGENACSRWHRDNYVGRAVSSYNESGTQFIHNDHVNMMQLENRGLNPGIVPDQSRILNAGVGDILFMKGLVHRSPPPRWRADGTIVNRLLLKVDLN